MDLKLRCSASGCECPNFGAAPSKETLRICDGCSHSWMTHLLEKLLTSRDDALSIFDVCSLALYGTHALPIRIKIVMERLLSTLQPEEVDKILRSFGWTVGDLSRGYMVQDPRSQPQPQQSPPTNQSTLFPNLNNNVMTRWTIIPRDEELLILQQFLRFPATRTLSFSLLRDEFPMNLNGIPSQPQIPQPPLHNSPPQSNFPPAMAAAAATAASILNPLKFNGLFGLGMNLLPPMPPQQPVKREVLSPQPPKPQEHRKPQPMNLSGDVQKQNGNFDPYDKHKGLDLSFNGDPRPNDKKPYNLRETGSHLLHQQIQNHKPPHESVNLTKKEVPKEETRKSRPVNQKHRHWETSPQVRSPQHHQERHHHQIQNQAPMPPPAPGHNMAAAVAASAAAAVNAAAVSAQQLVNPVTGKRRVQCAVCLKTFCDKGALKIHFSAVHLREMHKCTVQGCNMMFSSRRSRNRHSANPNPKLHSPHLRRKISPHDGRTAQPLISLQNPMIYGHAAAAMAAMRMPPGGGGGFLGNGFGVRGGKDGKEKKKGPNNTSTHTSDSEDPGFNLPMSLMGQSDDEDDSYMIHHPSDEEDDDGTGIHIPDEMMMVMDKPEPKKQKEDDSDSFSSTNEELDKQALSPEQVVSRKEGSRKRKLTAPVRLPSVPDDSNDEFCCYDDGTEVGGGRQRQSPGEGVNGSPPMLMSSNRSLSRTPELMPAAAGDEVEGEEEKGEGAKGKEYNLRKKSNASFAEIDEDEEIIEEFGSSGGSSPGKEGSLQRSQDLRNKSFWNSTSHPNRAFEVNAQVYSGRL